MAPTFIRQDYMRHIKIGSGRKKLLKWRRPKGRHSKMRKQRKGYPAIPTVGYKAPKKEYGKECRDGNAVQERISKPYKIHQSANCEYFYRAPPKRQK